MSGWSTLERYEPSLDEGKLDLYVAELVKWNKAIRLVGPSDADGIRLQVVDSLLPLLVERPRFPLLDIGSGAGLPAIPLAIASPGQPITCLEPRIKRVSFLNNAVRVLGLTGVRVVEGRAGGGEPAPGLFASFNCVTARAVSDVPTLLGWAAPYLAQGGEVLLGRGGDDDAPRVGGWRVSRLSEYPSPEGVGRRFVVGYRRDP